MESLLAELADASPVAENAVQALKPGVLSKASSAGPAGSGLSAQGHGLSKSHYDGPLTCKAAQAAANASSIPSNLEEVAEQLAALLGASAVPVASTTETGISGGTEQLLQQLASATQGISPEELSLSTLDISGQLDCDLSTVPADAVSEYQACSTAFTLFFTDPAQPQGHKTQETSAGGSINDTAASQSDSTPAQAAGSVPAASENATSTSIPGGSAEDASNSAASAVGPSASSAEQSPAPPPLEKPTAKQLARHAGTLVRLFSSHLALCTQALADGVHAQLLSLLTSADASITPAVHANCAAALSELAAGPAAHKHLLLKAGAAQSAVQALHMWQSPSVLINVTTAAARLLSDDNLHAAAEMQLHGLMQALLAMLPPKAAAALVDDRVAANALGVLGTLTSMHACFRIEAAKMGIAPVLAYAFCKAAVSEPPVARNAAVVAQNLAVLAPELRPWLCGPACGTEIAHESEQGQGGLQVLLTRVLGDASALPAVQEACGLALLALCQDPACTPALLNSTDNATATATTTSSKPAAGDSASTCTPGMGAAMAAIITCTRGGSSASGPGLRRNAVSCVGALARLGGDAAVVRLARSGALGALLVVVGRVGTDADLQAHAAAILAGIVAHSPTLRAALVCACAPPVIMAALSDCCAATQAALCALLTCLIGLPPSEAAAEAREQLAVASILQPMADLAWELRPVVEQAVRMQQMSLALGGGNSGTVAASLVSSSGGISSGEQTPVPTELQRSSSLGPSPFNGAAVATAAATPPFAVRATARETTISEAGSQQSASAAVTAAADAGDTSEQQAQAADAVDDAAAQAARSNALAFFAAAARHSTLRRALLKTAASFALLTDALATALPPLASQSNAARALAALAADPACAVELSKLGALPLLQQLIEFMEVYGGDILKSHPKGPASVGGRAHGSRSAGAASLVHVSRGSNVLAPVAEEEEEGEETTGKEAVKDSAHPGQVLSGEEANGHAGQDGKQGAEGGQEEAEKEEDWSRFSLLEVSSELSLEGRLAQAELEPDAFVALHAAAKKALSKLVAQLKMPVTDMLPQAGATAPTRSLAASPSMAMSRAARGVSGDTYDSDCNDWDGSMGSGPSVGLMSFAGHSMMSSMWGLGLRPTPGAE